MAFVSLIVDTMLPEWPLLDMHSRSVVHNSTTAHVARALRLAPFHIRLGVGALSLVIGFALLLLSLGPGRGAAWRSRADIFFALLQKLPGPFAAAVRLYRSVTLLAFYEHPMVATLLMEQRRA